MSDAEKLAEEILAAIDDDMRATEGAFEMRKDPPEPVQFFHHAMMTGHRHSRAATVAAIARWKAARHADDPANGGAP